MNNTFLPISDTSFDGRLLSNVVLKYSPPPVLLPIDVVDIFLSRTLMSLCEATRMGKNTANFIQLICLGYLHTVSGKTITSWSYKCSNWAIVHGSSLIKCRNMILLHEVEKQE